MVRLEILISSITDDSPIAEKARLLSLDGRGAVITWLSHQSRNREFCTAEVYRDLEGYISLANARMILHRLTKEGQITRLRDGVYQIV